MSTNCRSCQTYFKIEDGVAIPPVRFEDNPRYQASPTESAATSEPEPSPHAKEPIKAPKKTPKTKENISPLPSPPPQEAAPAPQALAPTPPIPQEMPPEKSPPAAAIPSTQPRNPLPKKAAKPKAPPPPPKPEPLPPAPVEELADKEPSPKAATETPLETPEPEASPASPERYRPPSSPSAETSKPKIVPLINREKKRNVKCFECNESHEILADSTSAMCPHCGAYIGLKDYDIREQENSRIQTRGNVFIHKKGYVTGITIHAHNLIIEGEIQGGAECTGDFVVRKNGKINGAVSSDRVIIERRAEVDFLSTVEAREVIIDGHVTGSVACKKLVLKKRATLDGDLTVASLSVEEGAKHTGKIQMTGLL